MDRRWPAKDPDEILDYMVDWRSRLASLPAMPGDTIASVVWEVAPAADLSQPRPAANTPTSTTIWLGGGVPGRHGITCRVTTVQGRTMEETYWLVVRDSGS